MATATLSKWGNSQGVILPKALCDLAGISIGDKLDLKATSTGIEIKPCSRTYRRVKKLSAYDLFANWEGEYVCPPDLAGETGKECNWGKPVGKEMW